MVAELSLLLDRINGDIIGCRLTKRVRSITPILDTITLHAVLTIINKFSIGGGMNVAHRHVWPPPPVRIYCFVLSQRRHKLLPTR